jgi:hypothetical protein
MQDVGPGDGQHPPNRPPRATRRPSRPLTRTRKRIDDPVERSDWLASAKESAGQRKNSLGCPPRVHLPNTDLPTCPVNAGV